MLYATIKTLVLPPTCFFVLFIIGWLLWKWWRPVGTAFLLGLLAAVYLATTPFLAGELMAPLQRYQPVDLEKPDQDVGAIVVLGAGIHSSAPEYSQPGAPPFGVDVADSLSLQRVAYAAYLAQRTGKPILLTGGSSRSGHRSVASAMKNTLELAFGLEPRWLEERSTTTFENAQYSAELLRNAKVKKVYLVTHAWHMPRAVLAFEKAGLSIVPAPAAFVSRSEPLLRDFVPSAQASLLTYYAIHEWLGIVWYELEPAIQ